MATFDELPVNDDSFAVQVVVDDGDDIVTMDVTAYEGRATARVTIEEALALIATLSGAVAAALVNRKEASEE